MRLFKITNGFDQMTDAYLLVRASFILASMSGNTHFPTPTPSLSEINTLIGQLTIAVHNAEGGSKQDIVVKNELRQQLIDKLHLLGNYVLFTAGGNEVIAQSSGFNISKVPQAAPAVTAPDRLALKSGLNSGELELSCKRVAGAKSYVHEITEAPVTAASVWAPAFKTVSKNVFSGLLSGKTYACRVAAIGVKDQMVYSSIVTRMAV